jgi:two-component system response regulator PilR (NtrC family)
LVVDDEPDLRTLYELSLLREGHQVATAADLAEAHAQLAKTQFDLVLTDMRLPDGDGLSLVKAAQTQQRNERYIVVTAYGSAENAVEALKAGAFDYLTKPVDLQRFRDVVRQAVSTSGRPKPNVALAADSTPGEQALTNIVGISQAIQQVRERILKVAPTMAPVLIRGESGTGKELVARALHACSHRHAGPFVAVNCSAIPEALLEAEFFGAKRGAYTGSTADRVGYFQSANGGTLFLDEIGDLPLSMQAKLLRAIQERSVRALGGSKEDPVDVRILSATHKDLPAAIASGEFRQDLFYRINVIDVALPALRDRREDLPALSDALLRKIGAGAGVSIEFTASDLAVLEQLELPGNVRELENTLHRAWALGDGGRLYFDEVATCPQRLETPAVKPQLSADATDAHAPTELPADLQTHMDQVEKQVLLKALDSTGFNRTAAAQKLGLSLRQIRYRMERLGIDAPDDAKDA